MTIGRLTLTSIVVVAATCGLLAGYALAPGKDRNAKVTPSLQVEDSSVRREPARIALAGGPAVAEYQALEQELERERSARLSLETKLERLQEARVRYETREADLPDHPITREHAQVAPTPVVAAEPQVSVGTHGQAKEWFNRDALVNTGLSNSEIREIEERWEEHEMQKLYLIDEATRNGTVQTMAFHKQLGELDRGVREDLGEDAYDAYLFATEKPNRVVLKQVLENSPAGYAGLQAGDVVVRYAGERVFHGIDFKSATNEGEAGSATPIEVLRGGEMLRFSVPRGPLGVQLNPILSAPDKHL